MIKKTGDSACIVTNTKIRGFIFYIDIAFNVCGLLGDKGEVYDNIKVSSIICSKILLTERIQ